MVEKSIGVALRLCRPSAPIFRPVSFCAHFLLPPSWYFVLPDSILAIHCVIFVYFLVEEAGSKQSLLDGWLSWYTIDLARGICSMNYDRIVCLFLCVFRGNFTRLGILNCSHDEMYGIGLWLHFVREFYCALSWSLSTISFTVLLDVPVRCTLYVCFLLMRYD